MGTTHNYPFCPYFSAKNGSNLAKLARTPRHKHTHTHRYRGAPPHVYANNVEFMQAYRTWISDISSGVGSFLSVLSFALCMNFFLTYFHFSCPFWFCFWFWFCSPVAIQWGASQHKAARTRITAHHEQCKIALSKRWVVSCELWAVNTEQPVRKLGSQSVSQSAVSVA